MLGKLLDLVWPRFCETCAQRVDRPGRYVCSDCLNRLPFVPTRGCCRQCGRDVEKLDVEFLCEDCRVYRPYFDRAASALRFNGDARRMLLDFKFNRHLWLRTDFADWLEGVTRARFHVDEIDLIAPVPTTWRHRWLRGYNQTDYLASALAARLEKPCQRRLLRRIGSPARQGGLSEEERRTNVKGTFAVAKPTLVRGKTVLVVDDVMTTGSTLSECARVLKVAGAARVWCVSLARSFRF